MVLTVCCSHVISRQTPAIIVSMNFCQCQSTSHEMAYNSVNHSLYYFYYRVLILEDDIDRTRLNDTKHQLGPFYYDLIFLFTTFCATLNIAAYALTINRHFHINTRLPRNFTTELEVTNEKTFQSYNNNTGFFNIYSFFYSIYNFETNLASCFCNYFTMFSAVFTPKWGTSRFVLMIFFCSLFFLMVVSGARSLQNEALKLNDGEDTESNNDSKAVI